MFNNPTKSLLTSTALIVLASSAANAGIRRHDRDDALYQALANESQFNPTVSLSISGTGSTTCSGTLISSEWILTAAHCFDRVGTDGFTIANANGTFAVADQIVLHPDWSNGQFTQGGDLALIHLSTPVLNVQPAMLYTGSNELGAVGTGVGYGAWGTGFTGDVANSAGTKRAGTNVIDVLGTARGFNESILLTDFDNPLNESDSTFGSPIPTDLEYQVAPGDSGGSLFIQENGQYYLAGVTSFINAIDSNPDGDYGDMSAYTRVSDYTAWINSVIPAPSTTTLFTLTLLTATKRRRQYTI